MAPKDTSASAADSALDWDWLSSLDASHLAEEDMDRLTSAFTGWSLDEELEPERYSN
jgi:hypothetical protein